MSSSFFHFEGARSYLMDQMGPKRPKCSSVWNKWVWLLQIGGTGVEGIWIDLLSLTILSSILDMKIQYVMPFQGESDLVFRLYTHTKVFNFVGIRVQRIMKAHLGGEKSQDLEILERKIYFYFFQ